MTTGTTKTTMAAKTAGATMTAMRLFAKKC